MPLIIRGASLFLGFVATWDFLRFRYAAIEVKVRQSYQLSVDLGATRRCGNKGKLTLFVGLARASVRGASRLLYAREREG